MFAAYYTDDPKAMYFQCDMALPVRGEVDQGEFACCKVTGGGRYFMVTLQGIYDFLELACYSAMCHVRKLKLDRTRRTLVVYENDPAAVAHSNEILISLYLPLKLGSNGKRDEPSCVCAGARTSARESDTMHGLKSAETWRRMMKERSVQRGPGPVA